MKPIRSTAVQGMLVRQQQHAHARALHELFLAQEGHKQQPTQLGCIFRGLAWSLVNTRKV